MRITLTNVKNHVEDRALKPIQVDGIPEGFSYKYPNITIGEEEHEGHYIAYIPFSDWVTVWGETKEELLNAYKEATHGN